MARKLIGSFYFNSLDKGQINGWYQNNKADKIDPEDATLIKGVTGDPFEGSYNTVWMEGSLRKTSSLVINKAIGRRDGYHLYWTRNGRRLFEGIAMLVELDVGKLNIVRGSFSKKVCLVGSYWRER